MAKKTIDIAVGSSYDGSGLRSATADVAKFREQLKLPAMGPLSREQSQVEDAARRRVRAMEVAGDKARIGSKVSELLFEGSGTNKQADAIKRVGEEAKKAVTPMGTMLEIIRKFGTSTGTDAIIEKMTRLAPKLGIALAISKALSMSLAAVNLGLDIRRHNRQGNLERQVEDEQKLEEMLTSVPIAGRLGAEIQRLNPLSSRRANEAAIEELADATKAQDAQMARRRAREQQDARLRESSGVDLETMRTGFASRGTSSERANYLQAAAAQAAFMKQLADMDGGGRKIEEAQEKRAAMAKSTWLSLFDMVKADGARVKGLLDGIADSTKNLVLNFKEEFTARQRIEGETRRTRLQTEGRGLEAEIDRVRSEAKAAAANELNPGNRQAIMEKAAAEETAIMRREHTELLTQKQDHEQRMLQSDSEMAERRLRMAGAMAEADKLAAKRGYEQRLEEIKTGLEQEIRAHKEREPELRKQAAEDAKAAGESYNLSMEEIQQRTAAQYRPGGAEGFTGTAAGLRGVLGQTSAGGDSADKIVRAQKDSDKISAGVKKAVDEILKALTVGGVQLVRIQGS